MVYDIRAFLAVLIDERFCSFPTHTPRVEVVTNTFEDALVYENLQVFRDSRNDGPVEKIKNAISGSKTAEDLVSSMFNILKDLKKAALALDLLEMGEEPWPIKPPVYISEGLSWLQEQVRQKQQELSVGSEPAAGQAGVAK